MVDILAGLAAAGVGVVLTIHQPRPDVFRLMHRVLLLSGRGQVRRLVVSTRSTLTWAKSTKVSAPETVCSVQDGQCRSVKS